MAFNVPFAALAKKGVDGKVLTKTMVLTSAGLPQAFRHKSNYAYMLGWDDYYAPRALQFLQSKGLRTKVGMWAITLQGKKYDPGTIMIPAQNQTERRNKSTNG